MKNIKEEEIQRIEKRIEVQNNKKESVQLLAKLLESKNISQESLIALNVIIDENINLLEELKTKYSSRRPRMEECSEFKEQIISKVLDNTIYIERIMKEHIKDIKNATPTENVLEVKQEKNLDSVEEHEKTISEEEIAEEKIENEENVEDKKDNHLLLISELKGKVYLPYKYSDLEEKVKDTEGYRTVSEVIQSDYIIDIVTFKNSTKSRFKEAYNLIKNKEKKSIAKATELGIELMFNYKLNPAVIAACKNEDELDIYLDCLDEDELDDFRIFDIQYEVAPMMKNKK